jgi:anionic cell wall polymer biosynthesis LytR-Cps2A-Psr (LCP) family protein
LQDLDGWKANRRKRQEQLMERVSEFKKSDSELNHGSRKSKTFSEMMK